MTMTDNKDIVLDAVRDYHRATASDTEFKPE